MSRDMMPISTGSSLGNRYRVPGLLAFGRWRRGQAVLEYCMMVVILVAALMAARRFFKAVLMGRWQSTADMFGFGRQYEPGRTTIAQ